MASARATMPATRTRAHSPAQSPSRSSYHQQGSASVVCAPWQQRCGSASTLPPQAGTPVAPRPALPQPISLTMPQSMSTHCLISPRSSLPTASCPSLPHCEPVTASPGMQPAPIRMGSVQAIAMPQASFAWPQNASTSSTPARDVKTVHRQASAPGAISPRSAVCLDGESSPRNRNPWQAGAVTPVSPRGCLPQAQASSSFRPARQDSARRKLDGVQGIGAVPRARSPAADDFNPGHRGLARATSPRDDRKPATGQTSVGFSLPPPVRNEDTTNNQTAAQLTQELDDMRKENARLQEKLTKAKHLMLKVQKEADNLRLERDRESMRAESLSKEKQAVTRQLKKECARVQSLEQQLAAVRREKSSQNDAQPAESPARANQRRAWVAETDPPKTGDANFFIGDSGGNDETRDAWQLAQEIDLGGNTPPRGTGEALTPSGAGKLPETGFAAPENVGLDFERSWEFVVQGQHVSGTQDRSCLEDFAAKTVSCFPQDAVQRALGRGVASVCSRGRRLDKTVPNQDDFVIARHTLVHGGHIAFYGVFDGHGPAGHHCAAFVRSSLPENLFGQRTLLLKPEETLREAFRTTQASLLDQPFETQHSGTTALVALVLSLPAAASAEGEASSGGGESWLFVAHVGDSRAILASHRGGDPSAFTVTALTTDHRPDDADEAERIRQNGGEVRRLHKNSGAARVFAPGKEKPGLALTRTFGASGAAECGVTAEPEVSAYRLRLGVDVLLVMGTDGLFEFCSNTHAAGHVIKKGVTEDALGELCEGSRQQWSQSSFNETVDDITCIAATLPVEPLEVNQTN